MTYGYAKDDFEKDDDDIAICECGDYQDQHENGSGKCLVCSWSPTVFGEPCLEFKST